MKTMEWCQPLETVRSSDDGVPNPSRPNWPVPHRPIVLTDPNWSFEQDGFDLGRFFEEAKISEASIAVLRNRFDRFATVSADEPGGKPCVKPADFKRINENYVICKPRDEERFFHAMDRRGKNQLNWEDFLIGCAAANPQTPHILNSHTGFVRARFIFEFYNTSRSGTLAYDELATLMADIRKHNCEENEDEKQHWTSELQKLAQDLGDVNVVTLRVNNLSGPLCEIRASTHWTGLQVRREIARELKVPVEGQELLVGQIPFCEEKVLCRAFEHVQFNDSAPTSMDITLVRTNWENWPCNPEPAASDGVTGLERLVHVTFQTLYKALRNGERLRGTSRLFRFKRSIMQPKKGGAGAMGGA